ncbi:MAG: phosphoribosyltransferase family protein, partial [Balneolales bacterium]
MEYRSFADLSQAINLNLHKIPTDVDLIVGVPRSGLLAGNMIALLLNIPLIDLDSYTNNDRLRQSHDMSIAYAKEAKHVLIVDDTCYSGKSMGHANSLIKGASFNHKITSCVIYINPKSIKLVDIYFETLESPGCQEWNFMHRDKVGQFCVDIDGVLCKDPTKQEDDDGIAYLNFLKNATPLYLPSHKVGCLVTGRLEKYRKETEEWLKRYNIRYHKLHMLDLPNAKIRWNLNAAPRFKAEIYKSYPHSRLFVESDQKEAMEISMLSEK